MFRLDRRSLMLSATAAAITVPWNARAHARQPSGDLVVAGGVDATLPSSTGGAAGSATAGVAASGVAGSGSAEAGPAAASTVAATASMATPRTITTPNAFPESRPPAPMRDRSILLERTYMRLSLPANRSRDSQRYASVTRPNSVSPASSG